MKINWKKLAEPQRDGSDTQFFQQLLRKNRRISHYHPEKKSVNRRYFNQRVACVPPGPRVSFDDLSNARLNHNNIAKAEQLTQQAA